jgi:hypothetical protein
MLRSLSRPVFLFLTLLIPATWFSCKQGANQQSSESSTVNHGPKRFELLDPAQTGLNFSNSFDETGEHNYFKFNYAYIGGAVGVGDFNNDGLPDLYMVATMGENKLYLNKGGFKFEDVTANAGVGAAQGIKLGVSIVDINNDGWLDIYQCRTGATPEERGNLLFVNNHDGTFTESSKQYGLDIRWPSTQAYFFDYDLDGDLDMYLLNQRTDFEHALNVVAKKEGDKIVHVVQPQNEYDSDRLFKNNGNGTFSDVSKSAGISDQGFGLSAVITDFNRDGYPDIYVANDYVEPDMLYINNHNGTFTDHIYDYMRHTSFFSMGTDMTDINNDGFLDLISLDMNGATNFRQKVLSTMMTPERYQMLVNYGYGHEFGRNMLQLNNGNGTFSEIANMAGMANTDWSWTPLPYDFDNDGYKDLFITKGQRIEVTNQDYINFTLDSLMKTTGGKLDDIGGYLKKIPSVFLRNYMFRNKGDLTFEDVSDAWGFETPVMSNGAVQVDLDNDGDLDLVVNNSFSPAFVYKNKTVELGEGHYLQIQLEGSPKNINGIGATVLAVAGDQKYLSEAQPCRGFLSTNSNIIHIGLGKATQVDQLTIQWPDNKVQTLEHVPANQRIHLKYQDAKPGPSIFKSLAPVAAPMFADITKTSGIKFLHRENEYYDFNRERLIPHKYSNIGPGLAKGDVNGDGLEDFYIGGAFLQTGALYIQDKQGKFAEITKPFSADTSHEDTAAIFFDADGDKDLDLFVVSGGNEVPVNSPMYQDRLYINDGKGNFQYDPARIPVEGASGSCVAAYDYDKDGDLDLFVGGGIVPGQFPTAPFSYIFQNNGSGVFTDVTQSVAPEFRQIGLVTSVLFADLDKDGQDEMLVTGEWMPIEVFKYKGGKFVRATKDFGLDQSNGWWNCLIQADFDGDGDLDLVAGNLGLNTRYRASAAGPLRLYAKDFDNNGSIDPIMAWYENGLYYPVPFRDPLIKQIPSLKKKFVRYTPYAKATIEDVYPKDVLATAQLLQASELRTCYFENVNGKFVARPLPFEAQIAPVKCILAKDVDGNGTTDLILTGNDYGPEVETGRYDAGNGLILLNNGKGIFTPVSPAASGFYTSKDARKMVEIKLANGKTAILVANNSDAPQLIQRN